MIQLQKHFPLAKSLVGVIKIFALPDDLYAHVEMAQCLWVGANVMVAQMHWSEWKLWRDAWLVTGKFHGNSELEFTDNFAGACCHNVKHQALPRLERRVHGSRTNTSLFLPGVRTHLYLFYGKRLAVRFAPSLFPRNYESLRNFAHVSEIDRRTTYQVLVCIWHDCEGKGSLKPLTRYTVAKPPELLTLRGDHQEQGNRTTSEADVRMKRTSECARFERLAKKEHKNTMTAWKTSEIQSKVACWMSP